MKKQREVEEAARQRQVRRGEEGGREDRGGKDHAKINVPETSKDVFKVKGRP